MRQPLHIHVVIRDTTGGRASAVSDYSANQLNQCETRTVPNKLDILGVANPGFGVQVWKDSDSPSTASRSGEYFHHALTVAYSSYPEVFAKSLFVPNQQVSAGRSFVPPATEQFFHDLDGNLIQDGRWTAYVWDGENRLIEMKRDTGTPAGARQRLTFEYDHLGRRVRKRFFTWGGTDWSEQRETLYLYDGWNVVAELDGNNANATLRTYVWGTDLSGNRSGAGGVGGLLWVNNSQTTGGLPTGIQFVAYDGNGNVVGLTSATDGSNTARYEYGPFGEPLRTTGPLAAANPIRWSTKVTDDESGLVYYGFRYYSPGTGRWLSRDPIDERDGANIYSLVGNDSIGQTDYLGMWTTPAHAEIADFWFKRSEWMASIECGCCKLNVREIIVAASARADGFVGLKGFRWLPNIIPFTPHSFYRQQSAKYAHEHAMSRPGQPSEGQESASAKFERFVEERIAAARSRMESAREGEPMRCKRIKQALEELGYAFHAITDDHSPMHRGNQEWKGLRSAAMHPFKTIDHGKGEGPDVWDAVTPLQKLILVGDLNKRLGGMMSEIYSACKK